MSESALCLLADLLNVPITQEHEGVLTAKDVRKIVVGGLSLSIPYEIVSSLVALNFAVAILHVGGKESSLYVLMAAHLGHHEQRGRAFMLDSRGMPGIGFDDWMERGKLTSLAHVFSALKDLPKGIVKKNWIWSQKASRWNAGPQSQLEQERPEVKTVTKEDPIENLHE